MFSDTTITKTRYAPRQRPQRTPPAQESMPDNATPLASPRRATAATLYQHVPHKHTPRNANTRHRSEMASGGLNARIATLITAGLGNMICAYIFLALAIYGFPGFAATPPQYVQWVSQTVIQLVALSVLAVKQNMDGRHAELLAEELYQTTLHTYHDAEQMRRHMAAQDAEMIAQREMLQSLLSERGIRLPTIVSDAPPPPKRSHHKKAMPSSH
jgi:hypothetical protein